MNAIYERSEIGVRTHEVGLTEGAQRLEMGTQKGSVQFIMFYLEVAPQLYLDVIQWLGRAGSNTQGRATT